ncbi:hypothetical protein DQ04_03451000 [Trypanosoma grayi]|uniref:hypothetical protein n=1 Tax=Trypanosoma grayi TaxID=71804 RepID=UPI0004F43A12|nr:hypothetical protein DQ04_03451000 [Trypanosoma grayi]KEG10658.1 hypothetical protein DQ04_03451000 [Trypanosoma grayi]
MQQNVSYATKRADLSLLHASLRRFEKAMQCTMAAMNEVRVAFEGVSGAFNGLTSLSSCGTDAKVMMQRFAQEMKELKDGNAFLMYNKQVHEEVLTPVKRLEVALSATEINARMRDSALKRYEQLRSEVERKESSYARSHKSLDTSKTYKKIVESREKALNAYETVDRAFNKAFETLMWQTGSVADVSMHRYIRLNSEFLIHVVQALDGAAPLRPYGESQYAATEIPASSATTCRGRTCASAPSCHSAVPTALDGASVPAEGVAHGDSFRDASSVALQQVHHECVPEFSDNPIFFRAFTPQANRRYQDYSVSSSLQPPTERGPRVDDSHAQLPGGAAAEVPRPLSGLSGLSGSRPSVYDSGGLLAAQTARDNAAGVPVPPLWRTQDLYGSAEVPHQPECQYRVC